MESENQETTASDDADEQVRSGPVLLAIHGKEETSAPIHFAHRLARHLGVELAVVTVGEPVYSYRGELAVGIMPMAVMYDDVVRVQEELVRRRVRQICGETGWELTTRYGAPPREIARRAEEVGATLIVVAAAPHRGLGHEVSGVRALQILRHASCPVVSITSELRSLPRTIVAAVDFSPASIRAAKAALLTLDSGGRLVLAHVPLPLPIGHPVQDGEGAWFGIDVPEAFERLRDELRPFLPAKATLETRRLVGRVAGQLLALAEEIDADLLTVGKHSRNVIERLFVGSVTTTVMHAARCSVLASPE
jgi:nucleotide-binding universal stress UspA family protein